MNEPWEFPYPSQRMPVFARNVVATSQPLAAQAGLRMLLKGGNAEVGKAGSEMEAGLQIIAAISIRPDKGVRKAPESDPVWSVPNDRT